MQMCFTTLFLGWGSSEEGREGVGATRRRGGRKGKAWEGSQRSKRDKDRRRKAGRKRREREIG